MANPELERLRADLHHLEHEMDADPACVARARKLVAMGKLKRPELVKVWADDLEVGVTCEDPEEDDPTWMVVFRPDGTFELKIWIVASSDGRITRVLKALGEIHKR